MTPIYRYLNHSEVGQEDIEAEDALLITVFSISFFFCLCFLRCDVPKSNGFHHCLIPSLSQAMDPNGFAVNSTPEMANPERRRNADFNPMTARNYRS